METQRPEPHGRTCAIGPKSSKPAAVLNGSKFLKHVEPSPCNRHILSLQVPLVLSGFIKSFAALLSQKNKWTLYIYFFAIENRIFQHMGRFKSKYYIIWTCTAKQWSKKSLPESNHLQRHEKLRAKMCLYPSLVIKALKMLKCIF